MCGFVALLDVDVPETAAERALATLTHRGPDSVGTWSRDGAWLGCRRLAVVDPRKRSDQPLVDHATGLALVFNGEIYNFRDLRRELQGRGHAFATDSDTEVVLHAYRQWGSACLERFNGMWALALFDPETKQLFFSRDRLGVKPLYCAHVASGIAFASEPKALLALDPALSEPDYRSLAQLLIARRSYRGEETFYSRVRCIPPASYGTIESGSTTLRTSSFWRPGPARDCLRRRGGSDLGQILERSVRSRLDCDRDVALALSGGLDSTAILVASRGSRGSPIVRAYTSTYEQPIPREDRPWARIAARGAALELEEVPAPFERWLDTLHKIVWHMDGPGYTPAVYPLWMLMEAARRDGVKVMLDGQGADELLAGYPRHASAATVDALHRHRGLNATANRVAAFHRRMRAAAAASSWPRIAQDLVLETSAHASRLHRLSTNLRPCLSHDFALLHRETDEPMPEPGERLLTRLLRDLTTDVLPGFLHYGDAISMAHGVEVRQPFLDVDLVEYCLRLDPRLKFTGRGTKAPLRRYVAAKGQTEIADRRFKQGYPTPTNTWMRRENGALLREILLDPGARIASFTVKPRLERLIACFARGHSALGEPLYSLIATELWLQRCATWTG